MAAATPFRLGRFLLDEFIAQGGMGRVWRGRAAGDRTYAIKVLRPDTRDRRLAALAFRREAQAVARLRHRFIVPIYDFGEVSEHDADNSSGRIELGSPFLVMEHIDGPPLARASGTIAAEELRRLVSETLEALAHSHARGIVHRDLKPSNILLADATDSFIGTARLTDFGIAHAMEDGDGEGRRWAEGTPGFMAPEQRSNAWRDFGPWTDLYALGRLVGDLLARAGEAGSALRGALAPWLDRMCAEDFRARFQRAADAATALAACKLERGASLRASSALPLDTVTTMVETSPGAPIRERPGASPRRRTVAESAPPFERDIPADWRQLVEADLDAPLPPWGLGLYNLRPRAIIARDHERDLLWSALRGAALESKAVTILLRGPAGVGKSRLARWLCELAHEVGIAEVIAARFSSGPEPHQGIGAMLRGHFRVDGLGRAQILARLEPALRELGLVDPTDWLVLTELCVDDDANKIRFGSERERNRALLRFFAALSRQRPLILWADDVHTSRAAVALIAEIEEAVGRGETRWPLVVVATSSSDEKGDGSPELVRLAETVRCVDVAPLPASDHKRLVRSLLALEDSLAARVERRSDGNPLFAEQLIGDLIARDVLVVGLAGRFRMKRGAKLDLPAGLGAVWHERLAAVVRSDDDMRALELAATGGAEVAESEWMLACTAAGITFGSPLVETLFEAGLAEAVRDRGVSRWRFAHRLLRESIEERARGEGRFESAHAIWAELLDGVGGALASERVGRHRLAAGDLERAEPLLLAAAVRRHQRGEFRDAHYLLAEREAALAVDIAESDPRRLSGWLILARCCRTEGELDEAREWAHRAALVGQRHGQFRIWCEALLVVASVARLRGDNEAAREAIGRARQLADRVKDPLISADCTCELAWIRQGSGDAAGALPFFKKALTLLEGATGDHVDPIRGSSLNGLAHGALQLGDPEAALSWLEQALALHDQFGSPTHRAYTLGALGDTNRALGRLDEAERCHALAYELLGAVGYGHMAYLMMNLGLVELDRRRFAVARRWFARALEELSTRSDDPTRALPHAMSVPCCAAEGDWIGFDENLVEATSRLGVGRIADLDVAEPLFLAGELAAGAGELDRASAAYAAALGQFRELGRQDRVRDATERMSDLGGEID